MALRALYPARARGCGVQRLAALVQVEVAFDRLLLRLVFGQGRSVARCRSRWGWEGERLREPRYAAHDRRQPVFCAGGADDQERKGRIDGMTCCRLCCMDSRLEERVSHLEKKNRLLLAACISLATIPLLVNLFSNIVPAQARARTEDKVQTVSASSLSDVAEVVRASRFELVDAEGKVRAELGFTSFGVARLMLFDETAPRVLLFGGSEAGGPSINLADQKAPRLTLKLEDDDSPVIVLQNYREGESLVLRPGQD